MRRLMMTVIVLIALFTLIRAAADAGEQAAPPAVNVEAAVSSMGRN